MDSSMNELNTSWHSYPKIYAMGHRYISELLLDPVIVEEKFDGSQYSCGLFKMEDGAVELRARSKGAMINLYAPEQMFKKAVEVTKTLDLHIGWTYRMEYLAKPKHHTLCYDRIPKNHLIVFDINTGDEQYLSYEDKKAESERIGLECVPLLFQGMITNPQQFRDLLQTVSLLGGQRIEGVVVKNYSKFGEDKKVLMGKFVSEEFKESHGIEWRKDNPTQGDVIQAVIESLKTPARWQKAIQHLQEAGKYEGSPRDIGKLIAEVHKGIEEECSEQIKTALFKWAYPQIKRGVCGGLAEWYKEFLLKKQFENDYPYS